MLPELDPEKFYYKMVEDLIAFGSDGNYAEPIFGYRFIYHAGTDDEDPYYTVKDKDGNVRGTLTKGDENGVYEGWIDLTGDGNENDAYIELDTTDGTVTYYIASQNHRDFENGDYKDPVTGYEFIWDTENNKYVVKDKNGNVVGELVEGNAGVYEGNVNTDGDDNTNTHIKLDTTETPPKITVESNELEDKGSGNFESPVTGWKFICDSEANKYIVKDNHGNKRGTLTEKDGDAGFYEGTVDADGDGTEETEVTLDTHETPPKLTIKEHVIPEKVLYEIEDPFHKTKCIIYADSDNMNAYAIVEKSDGNEYIVVGRIEGAIDDSGTIPVFDGEGYVDYDQDGEAETYIAIHTDQIPPISFSTIPPDGSGGVFPVYGVSMSFIPLNLEIDDNPDDDSPDYWRIELTNEGNMADHYTLYVKVPVDWSGYGGNVKFSEESYYINYFAYMNGPYYTSSPHGTVSYESSWTDRLPIPIPGQTVPLLEFIRNI